MAHASWFTIGTISFARCGKTMVLRPSERVRLILAALEGYQPDLLVTAGYAVHSPKQLAKLARGVAELKRQTLLLTEVHHDTPSVRPRTEPHALWAINGAGRATRLGNQLFATGKEAEARAGRRVEALGLHIGNRAARVKGLKIVALCCGEINVVRGGREPRFANEKISRAILSADVVVNPTHDRMSNAGILQAKRRFLSQATPDRSGRLYVSCSNWEACGEERALQYPSPTLHTIYQAGRAMEYEEMADGTFGFVFRMWSINFKLAEPARRSRY